MAWNGEGWDGRPVAPLFAAILRRCGVIRDSQRRGAGRDCGLPYIAIAEVAGIAWCGVIAEELVAGS